MFPCVSPNSRSRSSGVNTCRPIMILFRLGANSAIVLTTLSPNRSRCSSHVPSPSASLYGAYCTKQESTCLPGGATDGSVRLGITMSIYGRREKWPYFASSYARSMYSTLGEIEIAPRRCVPAPGRHRKSGSASSARFTLPEDPRNLYRRTSSRNSAGSSSGSRNFSNVKCGSTPDDTTVAEISSPSSSATPVARPFLARILLTEAFVRISAPASCAAAAMAFEMAPVPPRLKPQERNAPSISPM